MSSMWKGTVPLNNKLKKLMRSRRSPFLFLIIVGVFVFVVLFQSNQTKQQKPASLSSDQVVNVARGYNAYPDASAEDIQKTTDSEFQTFDRAPMITMPKIEKPKVDTENTNRNSDLTSIQIVQHYTRPRAEIEREEKFEKDAAALEQQQRIESRMLQVPPEPSQLPEFSKVPLPYAPTGRLVKAKLVTRIESGNYNAPIIALVTEALKFNGRTIIPVNTEMHGRVDNGSGFRSRLAAEREWVFVLPAHGTKVNGSEMVLVGDVLDRGDRSTQKARFTSNDMSYGFLGYRTKSDDLNDLRVFLSSFLLTAGEFSKGRSQSDDGEYVTTNVRNGAISGTQSVIDTYAKRIQEEVALNGFYTVVPSGHEFYLYVDQTILLNNAAIGGRELYIAQQQAISGNPVQEISDLTAQADVSDPNILEQLLSSDQEATPGSAFDSSLLNTVIDPERLKILKQLTDAYGK